MDDEALKALRALESIPWRPKTPRERKRDYRRQWGPGGREGFEGGDRRGGHESFIDLFNRLSAQHGTAVTDGLIEGEWPPFDYFRIVSHINDDLDLWFEATGERTFAYLRVAERLGLECWLWETHDRQRQDWRFKPRKSPKHDIPWPGARPNWAPRRWFPGRGLFLSPGKGAWEMSISRALKTVRDKARAELGAEISKGEWGDAKEGGWFTDTKITTAGIYERNHPKPQAFWDVKWDSAGRGPIWKTKAEKDRPRWEPCDDEPYLRDDDLDDGFIDIGFFGASVFWRQTHERPKEPAPSPARRLPAGVRLNDYWRRVKGRELCRVLPQWSAPRLEELPNTDRVKWITPSRFDWGGRKRPKGEQYALDLYFERVKQYATPTTIRFGERPHRAVTTHPGRSFKIEYTVSIGDTTFPVALVTPGHNDVARYRLRSPYEPRGFVSERGHGWAVDTPNRRPGAWAREHVEAPADALSAECKRVARLGMGDDLDRLAMSAAIEAAA